MRSKEAILNDFNACHINDCDCKNCSYGNINGTCTDRNNNLEEEIIKLLKSELLESNVNDYNKGLEDAFELLKEIYNINAKDIQERFDVNSGFYGVIKRLTIHEIKEKFEKWQKQKCIGVGDVVEYEDVIGVVLDLHDDCIEIFDENGCAYLVNITEAKKTNESLKDDVDTLLKKLRDINYLIKISE